MAVPLELSVVRIYSKSGKVIGAGFLVSSKHVLTCAHVVTDALGIPRTIQEQPDGVINLDFPLLAAKQMLAAKIIFWRPVNPNEAFEDIAGLELETALPDTAQPAQLVTSEDLWGHPFRVLGFPAGQPNGVSASGVLRSRIANNWVQLEDVKQPGYRLEPGFSGAPVWDEELQGVAGMAVAAEMNRADVKAAFIIPTRILVNAWSDLDEQAIPSCPYRGLFAFREQDAKFFFGRETFTEQLVAVVQRQPLVAVIGSSGSGKSSVVFAGFVPQLRQQGDWLINSFRPGERPFRNLAAALVPLLETQMSETDQLAEINKLAKTLRLGDVTLQDVVKRILEKNSSTRLLLVADQFEELYTLCRDVEERQGFLEQFLEAFNILNFTFVLALRADFLGYALSYRPFADALQNADVKLAPMNRQELQDAIAKPAQLLGVRIESGLTERILEAVEKEPGNLPLLEFALTLLWAKQRNGQLTHQAYEDIGGVEKALAGYAEAVYSRLSEVDRQVAQWVFVQLVCPGAGTEDTRRLATRDEVGEDKWDLVRRLADARLVVTGWDEGAGKETVEIVHEALIRQWGRLRGWMESDRTFRSWQERLRTVMRQWESTGQDEAVLLRGTLLAEAEAWQQKRSDELSEAERDFILLSLALRDKEKDEREQRQQRELELERLARQQLRWLVAALSTIVIGTTSVLAYPYVLSYVLSRIAAGAMKDIRGGIATIGTNDPLAPSQERPKQHIRLAAFQIEQYEVSNRQYRFCVQAGKCSPPATEPSRYYNDGQLHYPIVGITAIQAAEYCRWLGRRLPTELEWEGAARGFEPKSRLWPWGNTPPTRQRANILSGNTSKEIELVNSHPDGVTPEGIYNLVGNVREWTASYFPEYSNSTQQQVWDGNLKNLLPMALAQRGGSWTDEMYSITTRVPAQAAPGSESTGVRCAK
ncbi:SUMF1/EgtB/PvdO family nonheme iron enzyme [Coleofasciculus sp. FACHB-SPT36]|uniref:nSTAND1 domain-containing NTPase n=1 Tax=Cyanophyceae TaxID=3028117 RepID=UPI00168A6570|nr:SUMF1/EgtB/PvdO family nonheme iron enzyme [Coleofasciculus sp. FACHB-SPT36]MBD2538188.1 SUMF1/EgtB/PvdO family nonheme iron enzyme [Coleofasciculus sp. FACHB-SPT36]